MGFRSYGIGFAALLLGVSYAAGAFAATDISFVPGSIRFSQNELVAGQTVRVYAQLRNDGDTDVVGEVGFYYNQTLIGSPQQISFSSNGFDEQVYVDFVVPDEPFNLSVRMLGSTPADADTTNNEVLTAVKTPLQDHDRDGVPDTRDNCSFNANAGQENADGDVVGDACDADDDNDGLDDDAEAELGTNPFLADTDGDGTIDGQDPQPTNPAIHTVDLVITEPQPETSAQEVTTPSSEPVKSSLSSEPEPKAKESKPTGFLAHLLGADTQAELASAERGTPAGPGQLVLTSRDRHFVAEALSWSAYRFQLNVLNEQVTSVAWDFGDGDQSDELAPEHFFPGAGTYTVQLQLTTEAGAVIEDHMVVSLSFFHLANPVFLAFVIVLVVLALLMVATMFRLSSDETHESDEDER